MSSKNGKPSSAPETTKADVNPRTAVDEILRHKALQAAKRSEPTGTFGSTSEMLPDHEKEDDEAEEHQAPPSQSPRDQMRSRDFRHRARTALGYYGKDLTAISEDPNVVEDAMIARIDNGHSEAEVREPEEDEELSS